MGKQFAIWIAVGIGAGVAIGAGTHQLALWLCVGVVLGAVVGFIAGRQRPA